VKGLMIVSWKHIRTFDNNSTISTNSIAIHVFITSPKHKVLTHLIMSLQTPIWGKLKIN
jgi:hypothetical protein